MLFFSTNDATIDFARTKQQQSRDRGVNSMKTIIQNATFSSSVHGTCNYSVEAQWHIGMSFASRPEGS